ncbi:hypothetical protein [Pontiella sulfatireligans]|uniref:Uncharacterized protein n=1 Tax=Pontiella sulfatireligans TaxID=2750658 RepID=A0A6C2UF03_9BACT|nr:hypothetical protein [Pontiella sulfatireligans]VGO18001.1 hypothetical protein SCARR_00051 [Pontiella sulfatireligans]
MYQPQPVQRVEIPKPGRGVRKQGVQSGTDIGCHFGKENIRNDYDWLQQFVSVFQAMDADEPGEAASRLLVPRLGRERVYAVDCPAGCKDANDCMLNGHGLDWCIEHARKLDPEELRRAGEFRDHVWERFYPPDGQELAGDELPWPIGKFRLRSSELTIVHDYNGHGKSIALGQCLLHLAKQGRRSRQ